MLSRATIQNYKLLRDVTAPLQPLTVLVGRNGVGKSSVLDAIHLLLQLPGMDGSIDDDRAQPLGRPGRLFRGQHDLAVITSRPGGGDLRIEVGLGDRGKFGLVGHSQKGFQLDYQFFGGASPVSGHTKFPVAGMSAKAFFASAGLHDLASVARLRLDAEAMTRGHYSEREVPRMDHDGAGLASVLQYVQGLRDGTLEAIEADLHALIPEARRVRALPTRLQSRVPIRVSVDGDEATVNQEREVTGARFEVEWGSAGWVPAEHLSEGTVLALGILTVVHFRPPGLLLLDDVDRALHPMAQVSVINLLRKIQSDRPTLQVITTAHSPFVLDALDAAQVLVAGSAPDGFTRIEALSAHTSWAKRRGYTSVGEFWSDIGEGWVAAPP